MTNRREFRQARAALTRGETYTMTEGGVVTQEDVLQLMADCAMSKHEAIKRLAEYAASEDE